MRRTDRQIKEYTEIDGILNRCYILHLGLNDEGETYIVPVCFGYRCENETFKLFFHSANEGKKIELIKRSNAISFEAECSFEVMPNITACGYSALYESVIGCGSVRLLKERKEQAEAFDAIMKKYSDNRTFIYDEAVLDKTNLYEIAVTDICGKRNQ